MKTFTWIVILATLASAGCIWDQSFTWPPVRKTGSEPVVAKPQRSRAPGVRPEQVNENNAHQMVQALEAEMDVDEESGPLPAEEPAPGKRSR